LLEGCRPYSAWSGGEETKRKRKRKRGVVEEDGRLIMEGYFLSGVTGVRKGL
jgi:hypothetical protein